MLPEGYKLRRFKVKDQEAVKKLVEAVLREHGFPLKPELDSDLEAIKEVYGNGFFVLLKGKRIIGTVGIKPTNDKEAELKRLYLLPEERGKGLGSELFDAAVGYVAKQGFKKIKGDTHIRLKRALKLFRRKKCRVVKQNGNKLFYELSVESFLPGVIDTREMKLGLSRGKEAEKLVAKALQELQDEGRIRSFYRYDYAGVDFVVTRPNGEKEFLQVKAAHTDVGNHKWKYPKIPVVIVSQEHRSSLQLLKEEIIKVLAL